MDPRFRGDDDVGSTENNMANETKKHTKLIVSLLITMALMFGLCFALVPFYDAFCKATGLLGKTTDQRVRIDSFTTIDPTRTIAVEIVANVNSRLHWTFNPDIKIMNLHPGQVQTVNFFAENLMNRTVISQTIFSVSPFEAAKYIKKAECFSFSPQVLAAGQSAELPSVFFIDKDLPAEIKRITISYSVLDAG